jgi:hypothetical protein
MTDTLSRLPRLNALWIEGPLSYLEQVCLASAVSQGHELVLYTYAGVTNVPAGVTVQDGRALMSDTQLVRHRSGHWALASDLFRLEIMQRDLGIWIDTDVFFIKPLSTGDKNVFGWEDEEQVNGAVLRIDAESPLLASLRQYAFGDHVIPPWWKREKRLRYRIRSLVENGSTIADLPWGSLGPKALTYFISQLGMTKDAWPSDVFYPLHYTRAQDIFDPKQHIESTFTARTVAVHLWNHLILPFKNSTPRAGCFMAKICQQYGIA